MDALVHGLLPTVLCDSADWVNKQNNKTKICWKNESFAVRIGGFWIFGSSKYWKLTLLRRGEMTQLSHTWVSRVSGRRPWWCGPHWPKWSAGRPVVSCCEAQMGTFRWRLLYRDISSTLCVCMALCTFIKVYLSSVQLSWDTWESIVQGFPIFPCTVHKSHWEKWLPPPATRL